MAGAWEVYSKLEEFREVPYLQFVERVKAHREQVERKKSKATDDTARFMHYRIDNPAPRTFLGSYTHQLLREDVKQEVGRGITLGTADFRKRRPEYLALEPRFFGQRLRQERKYRKFCNHLESKREKNPYEDPRMSSERQPKDDPEQDEYDLETDKRSSMKGMICKKRRY